MVGLLRRGLPLLTCRLGARLAARAMVCSTALLARPTSSDRLQLAMGPGSHTPPPDTAAMLRLPKAALLLLLLLVAASCCRCSCCCRGCQGQVNPSLLLLVGAAAAAASAIVATGCAAAPAPACCCCALLGLELCLRLLQGACDAHRLLALQLPRRA